MPHRVVSIFLLSVGTLCAQAQSTYPVVSKAEQKARDDDRKPLLESELAFEREALEKAEADFAAAPTRERAAARHRHQENIKALQRELADIPGQSTAAKRARLVVKAVRPAARMADGQRASNFWDPYNRAPDTPDLSTSPRRDSHE